MDVFRTVICFYFVRAFSLKDNANFERWNDKRKRRKNQKFQTFKLLSVFRVVKTKPPYEWF